MISVQAQPLSRRRILKVALAGTSALAAGTGIATRAAAAAAATQLTSVAAMVADAEVAWERQVSEKWNKLHPEAQWSPEDVGWETIFEKVLAYEKAGSPPNLGYGFTGFTADWHQMGLIAAPEDYLGATWKARFAPYLTSDGGDVIDGKLWVVPIQAGVYGLVSRRDWLKEVSIEPLNIQTYDQLVEAVGKVASARKNKPLGIPLGNARNAGEKTEWLFRGNGLKNLADFDAAKRDAYIEVLETLLRLRPFIPDNAFSQDYTGHRRAFATGTAGFISIGDYYFGEIYPSAKQLMTPEHVVMIPYPSGSKGPGQPFSTFDMNSYYMMAHAQDKETTAKLIDFLTSRENLLRWSLGHPPLKDWTVDEAVKSRLYGDAERWWLNDVLTLSSKVPMLSAEGFVAKDEVQQAYYRALLKLFDGSLKPAQMYDTLNESIPKLIKGAKGG
jgi:ABC-type glycerol-3-phosphate transport system substrate-binding protein